MLAQFFDKIKNVRFVGDKVHSKLIDYFKQ